MGARHPRLPSPPPKHARSNTSQAHFCGVPACTGAPALTLSPSPSPSPSPFPSPIPPSLLSPPPSASASPLWGRRFTSRRTTGRSWKAYARLAWSSLPMTSATPATLTSTRPISRMLPCGIPVAPLPPLTRAGGAQRPPAAAAAARPVWVSRRIVRRAWWVNARGFAF